MSEAKSGDTVQVHYTGTLNDGTVFDSSADREPLSFTLGESQVIPGFEKAVMGMAIGQVKEVTIPVDDAYGPYRDELVLDVERAQFPDNINPQVGMPLQLTQSNGQVIKVVVKDVDDANVRLDANHPLAGQDLTFNLELVKIG